MLWSAVFGGTAGATCNVMARSKRDLTLLASHSIFAGSHHVRFIDGDVPVHIAFKTFQGRHLLRPCPRLNSIVLGVVGRAQQRYRDVRLYAMAFLSNHAHLMLQGPPQQVPAFIGFIKREVSIRWGPHVDWYETMWSEYVMLALPTEESQVDCLHYILSQGVKEGLVARAEEWPGVHCARALARGEALGGRWFDGTRYCREVARQKRCGVSTPICKSDYEVPYEVTFVPIPAWAELPAAAQRVEVQRLLDLSAASAAVEREGRAPLGARGVRRVPLSRRSRIPPVPCLERRRRPICWSPPNHPETKRHHEKYWAFQEAFREASAADAQRRGAVFPPGAYAPGRWVFPPGKSEEEAA